MVHIRVFGIGLSVDKGRPRRRSVEVTGDSAYDTREIGGYP